MRRRVSIDGAPVPVIRPLLDWRRSELAGIVAAAGLVAVDDPSNRDPAYDRTRWRTLLGREPLLRPAGLAAAAAHLADAEEALDWAVARLAAEHVVDGDGVLRLTDPHSLPREYRRRLVDRAIRHFAAGRSPRGDALDRLLRLLELGRVATLAGVMARPGTSWRFSLAPPRADRPRIRDGSPGASIAINPDRLI